MKNKIFVLLAITTINVGAMTRKELRLRHQERQAREKVQQAETINYEEHKARQKNEQFEMLKTVLCFDAATVAAGLALIKFGPNCYEFPAPCGIGCSLVCAGCVTAGASVDHYLYEYNPEYKECCDNVLCGGPRASKLQ